MRAAVPSRGEGGGEGVGQVGEVRGVECEWRAEGVGDGEPHDGGEGEGEGSVRAPAMPTSMCPCRRLCVGTDGRDAEDRGEGRERRWIQTARMIYTKRNVRIV